MAFVVEDGSGKPDASSFASIEQARAYADARGLELAEDDGDLEKHLTIATSWIVAQYFGLWLGEAATFTQNLPFPRLDVYNADTGNVYLPEQMPPVLIAATAELAAEAKRGALYYRPDPAAKVVTEKTIGPLTTKYAAPNPALYVALYNFGNVRALLAPLTREAQGNNRRGMNVRVDRG